MKHVNAASDWLSLHRVGGSYMAEARHGQPVVTTSDSGLASSSSA